MSNSVSANLNDLQVRLRTAIERAADCKLLGGLAAEKERRQAWRAKAEFYEEVAQELRSLITYLPARGEHDERSRADRQDADGRSRYSSP